MKKFFEYSIAVALTALLIVAVVNQLGGWLDQLTRETFAPFAARK